MKTALNSSSNTFSLNCFLDFKEITKAGLALSVLFSSIAGYFWVSVRVSFSVVCVDNASDRGGYCMVGVQMFNQVIEKDLDALMDRTKTVQFLREECLLFSIGCCERTTIGITLLYMINPKTAMFGAISIFHTPAFISLKRSHHYPFCGAFPGAIPYGIGLLQQAILG
jgi:protoheme IX farnesyltransferase